MSRYFESLLEGFESKDRKQIASIPEQFVARALDGDWEGVAELYHPTAIQMPPDQPAVEGREAIRHALSQTLGAEGGVRLEDFAVSVQEAEGTGELIFVRATYQLKVSAMVGQERVTIEQHGPYINILRRDETGQWRIYRQIYGRNHAPSMPGTSKKIDR